MVGFNYFKNIFDTLVKKECFMITALLAKIFGTNNARQVKRLEPCVEKINAYEAHMLTLSDEQLTEKTAYFKDLLKNGKTLDDILPEAFAVVRETARRKIGQRHHDVQLMGGIVMHQGKIAEMKTGEGKTLAATLPLYLNALTEKGAHLVTVNDYLARRDAEWMGTIYKHLGLTVGIIQNGMTDQERKASYASDIVYGTNNELGFDYLRDNMKFRIQDYAQRELSFAIVDEVDSILIDEARTPLIISGAAEESSKLYTTVNSVMSLLHPIEDYDIDEKQRNVQLTESGNDKIEKALGVENLYALENLKLLHHATQALKAHTLFKRDYDYVVVDDEVLIVDEHTGRMLPGRRYSDGLHQALEAKEGVSIENETQTLASITLQNFFRLYGKLAGMTGTADTEAEEFHKIYKLDVVTIPTNKPMIREDKADLIFLSKKGKYKAIVDDVKERHKKGQPVLIGTIAVETSELLSTIFKMNGIKHEVLNAKNHSREAEIVSHAGEAGHVTIATNMAGRGTDIKLTPEALAAGGLYILGTERHESRRIDNQLRGRSGRQGDAGESRFYISLEDDLMRIFGGGIKDTMEKWAGMTEDEIIESPFISKRIERAQEQVEKQNFEIRKHLLEYDDVLNQQRIVVYKIRRSILDGSAEIADLMHGMIEDVVDTFVERAISSNHVTEEDRESITKTVANFWQNKEHAPVLRNHKQGKEALLEEILDLFTKHYDLYQNRENQEMLNQAQKWIMLESIDTAWKQHMSNLDHLKEGINLRGWGQKNPLIEYKREAFIMFEDMMYHIKSEIMYNVFNLDLEHFDQHALEVKRSREMHSLRMSGPEEDHDDHDGHGHTAESHPKLRNKAKKAAPRK